MTIRILLTALLLAMPAAHAASATAPATDPPVVDAPAVHTPVATVRVAFDREGITSTLAQGLADSTHGRAITADDPVRIASISKLVTTIALMRLVEAGTLDLDADAGELLGWPLRNPAHPDTPVTLRLLLSHTSSLTDDAGYWQPPLGARLRGLLDDPRAWDPAHAPGTYFRYSNLNFPLVAPIMERATGERFDRLVDRLVLAPLDIDACFNWTTCSDAAIARAVVLHDADGTPIRDALDGQRPACPVITAEGEDCDLDRWRPGTNGALFSPQGGLRISANGLARIGRMLLGGGEVDGVRLLAPETVQAMATPRWTWSPGTGSSGEEEGEAHDGFYCRFGLSMHVLATPVEGCRDDPFGDGIARVGHSGSAYGLQSGLWLDLEGGTGVAWFLTGMPAGRSGGHSAFSAAEETLAEGVAGP